MCADGVVIAADSQITDSDRGMSFPGQKLHHLGDHAAWAGSGARGVLTDVEKALDAAAEEVLAADEVSHALQELALPILRRHYDLFISDIPGEDTQGTPSAFLPAAGYSKGDPFIIEINPNGMVSRYEDIGFHAIGSGAPMAQQAGALLAHFQHGRQTRGLWGSGCGPGDRGVEHHLAQRGSGDQRRAHHPGRRPPP